MLFKNKHNWKTPRNNTVVSFLGLFLPQLSQTRSWRSQKNQKYQWGHTKWQNKQQWKPALLLAKSKQPSNKKLLPKKKNPIKYHRKKLAQPPPLLADWMGTWVVHPHQDRERPPPQLLQSPRKTNGEHELPLPPGRNNQPILRCGVVSEGNLWRVNAFTINQEQQGHHPSTVVGEFPGEQESISGGLVGTLNSHTWQQ